MTEHRISINEVFLMMVICGIFAFYSQIFAQANCTGTQILQATNCTGDEVSSEEKILLNLVNRYRVANGRSELRSSNPLSMVANRRVLDLKQNLKSLTHSWSNCKYDINDQKTWPCVTDSPKRLKSGYDGRGYETLYRTAMGRALSIPALDAWKKSPLHNSIILNLSMFKDLEWEELGVAIDGQFAALWFGAKGGAPKGSNEQVIGLGVSYDQAVKGLNRLLAIDQFSSTVENNRWQGFSPDRKIKLEIYGTKKELSEVNLGISIKLESDQTLAPKNKLAVVTLLKNIFPEWSDPDAWFENSLAVILADKSGSRTKIVRKIALEMLTDGQGSVKLLIKHQEKPKYIEIY
ncbi:MAG: hypothetical protein WBD16_04350 [Pyrinomonadaceae bacterium]